jgi:hypothetical protein
MLVIRSNPSRNINDPTSDLPVTGLLVIRTNNSDTNTGLIHIKRDLIKPLNLISVTDFELTLGSLSTVLEFRDQNNNIVPFIIEGNKAVFSSSVNLTSVKYTFPRENINTDLFGGMILSNIDLTRTLGNPSSLSFDLIGRQTELNDLLIDLSSGSEFNFLGLDWYISDLNIDELKKTENSNRLVRISLNCESKWKNYTQPVEWTSSNQDPARVRDINSIVNSTRQCLSIPFYEIALPETKQLSSSFSGWENDATDICTLNGGVLDYDSPVGIGFINILDNFDNITHIITEREIRSSISTSLGANIERRSKAKFSKTNIMPDPNTQDLIGNELLNPLENFSGFNRVFDYQQSELNGSIYNNINQAIRQEIKANTITNRKAIRRRRIKQTTKSGSNSFPSFVKGFQLAKDLSMSFDQSGVTTSETTTTTIDGKVLIEETTRYGFVITGQDISNGASLLSLWQPIESSRTVHQFGAYGYYLGYTTKGWKLVRYSKEDPRAPETIDQPDSDFEYTRVETEAGQSLTLRQAKDFYLQEDNTAIFTDSDGIPRLDPTYVPDFLVVNELEWSFTHQERLNPDDNRVVDNSGNEYLRTKERVIYSGLGTVAPYYLSADNFTSQRLKEIKDREHYIEINTQFGSDGNNYQSYAQSSDRQIINGRPNIGDRLPNLYEFGEIGEDENKPDLLSKYYRKIYLNSDPNYQGSSRSSETFNRARTLQEVRKASELKWLLQNANGNTISLSVTYSNKYKPGQFVLLTANGLTRKCLILSVNSSLKSLTNNLSDLSNHVSVLKLGLTPLNPSNQVNIDLIPNLQVSFTLPYYVGTTLRGSASLTGLRSRYNSSL